MIRQRATAIAQAKTPVMDELMTKYPFVRGNGEWTGSRSAGRTDGKSEVGHLNMAQAAFGISGSDQNYKRDSGW